MSQRTSINLKHPAKLDSIYTEGLINNIKSIIQTANNEYEAAKIIAKDILGVRKIDNNKVQFGFWIPGLKDGKLKDKEQQFKLELFTPIEAISPTKLTENTALKIPFRHDEIQLIHIDEYMVGIIDNINTGNKNEFGSFYWLKYYSTNNSAKVMRDPLAQSVPFGIYAPAEVYDIEEILKNRKDKGYFKTFNKIQYPDGLYRARDIGSTLEIHTETATREGTIQALTEKFKSIASKINDNIKNNNSNIYATLTADELHFTGFDTIELTPEVPPVERETIQSQSGEFFNVKSKENSNVLVELKKPDISNWGYDTPITGTAALNPSILRTLRPDEFLEFIETLHTMPDQPIQLSLDAVLGHADFQGARLLETFDETSPDPSNIKYINSKYFRGPNMYGRDINYANPQVRAILLEMLRRKINYGFDCLRVDGGQDFVKYVDDETGFRIQDDIFINEMINTIQEIDGNKRLLDTNIEDGRPWPNDMNWLYNATYTEHTLERTLPHEDKVKQWGPLIFAHNVHGKFKWFQNKWDRFKDNFKEGQYWITGHSNHDNARYFYRLVKIKPGSSYTPGELLENYYNDEFGKSLPEAAHNILDNGALSAINLAFLPGSPMFFLNALFHTPWLFFRDIDNNYGVKVTADEGSRFLNWYIDNKTYDNPKNFQRLKELGFKTLNQLINDPSKEKPSGFMDILFNKHEKIKTDPVMVLYLYDSPEEEGHFKNADELKKHYKKLTNPLKENDIKHQEELRKRIFDDTIESKRKVKFARTMLNKSLGQIEKDLDIITNSNNKELEAQREKLIFLKALDNDSLALLLEDAASINEYNIQKWAKDKKLTKAAPEKMKQKGKLTEEKLKEFALAFMLDARDVSKVNNYENTVNKDLALFNFNLRLFRRKNPWLINNPGNDITKDFFNRKIITNGAKDLGAFFSDKGDLINSNTIYYGWRTNPENTRQIFIIANMEGNPLIKLALNQFINNEYDWKVVIKHPAMKDIPPKINSNFVLKDFKCGEVLVLERSIK